MNSNREIFEKYLEEKCIVKNLKDEAEREFEEHKVPEELAKKLIEAIFDFQLTLIKESLEEETGVSESSLYLDRLKELTPDIKVFTAQEQEEFNKNVEEDIKRRRNE